LTCFSAENLKNNQFEIRVDQQDSRLIFRKALHPSPQLASLGDAPNGHDVGRHAVVDFVFLCCLRD